MTETPVSLQSGGNTLRGVLHAPTVSREGAVGVVFLHGWSGCRLGPHRMFVKMARRLCEEGCHCLRFDFAGRGDSDGNAAAASINSMIEDTKCALEYMGRTADFARRVIVGICSGSKVAMGAAATTGGAGDLVLLSHEPMGELGKGGQTVQRKRMAVLRTYFAKLMRPETWRKILTGRVNTGMVGKALRQEEAADDAELAAETRWLSAIKSYPGAMLFVYGSNDPAARVARPAYEGFCRRQGIDASFHTVEDANHSFYSLAWEQEVLDVVRAWVATLKPRVMTTGPGKSSQTKEHTAQHSRGQSEENRE